MISKPMVSLAQTVQLSCTKTNTISKGIETRFYMCHLEVPSGASKMVSKAMVRLVQTMDLSCIDTNTISKRTETGFHMTHVSWEFHLVHPK
jgi:hypothetical protein